MFIYCKKPYYFDIYFLEIKYQLNTVDLFLSLIIKFIFHNEELNLIFSSLIHYYYFEYRLVSFINSI
jgi:hypothetical protein